MEDEEGDAAQGSTGGGFSVLPLSEKLPPEPFIENMGAESEGLQPFEEGDGDEIMVEIVGSDVFINGVSGEKGDCLVSGEVEDLEGGHAWDNGEEIGCRNFSEATDGNDRGERELGFVRSANEHNYVVISEEEAIKDESVDMGRVNLMISDIFSLPVEASVEGNIGIAEESGALSPKNDDAGNVDRLVEDSLMSGGAVLVTCCRKDAVVGPCEVKILDENEGCLNEFHDMTYASHRDSYVDESWKGKGEKFDGVLDFDDGASDVDLRDVNCANNEPTERAVGGEVADISEDNGVIIEIQADKEENQPSIKHIDREISLQSLESPRNVEGHTYERYLLHGGNFVQPDMVWGKVRSHPWWPGQIFDSSNASEKAARYYKKESYLVAYFGDRTFAWLDKSNLKPFGSYFSEMENQTNSEAFQDAVASALDEVTRRVELGLSCSCVPKDVYGNLEARIVGNAGKRERSSRRRGVDRSSQASCFEPVKLLEYVENLAPSAFLGSDRLDLVIARAQISAFCRFSGYRCLTEFASFGGLLDDAESEKMVGSEKRKRIPRNGSWSRKERSSIELMGDDEYSPVAKNIGKSGPSSSGKKRKASDRQADVLNKRATKESHRTSQNIKPSFKIGECIRRAASRLAGPASSVKSNNNDEIENNNVFVLEESLSVDEVLSQLEMVAQNPRKDDGFRSDTRTFFTGFRSSVVLNRRVSKETDESKVGEYREEFEFDDLNDSYWTDRIFWNDTEEEKSVKPGRRSQSRKRISDPTAVMDLDDNVERREQDWSPAELILDFADRQCMQSELNLNKMFRRFGPLMESETEVDRDSGRARVIFKRGRDAEVALNSAEKINIFGPVVVDYQIGYSPLISVKILPIAVPECQEDEAFMI